MMAAHIVPAQISPPSGSDEASPLPLSLSSLARTRSSRPQDCSAVEEQFPKQSRRGSILKKLAGPRENAKRFLRLRSSGIQPSAAPQAISPRRRPRPVSEIVLSPRLALDLPDDDFHDVYPDEIDTMAQVLPPAVAQATAVPELSTPFPPLRNERIVASGSGLTVGIALTEPVLYLQGYDQHDPSSKKSAILRGQIHLKVTKCVKIKKISICFKAHAQTDWPDGTATVPALLPQLL